MIITFIIDSFGRTCTGLRQPAPDCNVPGLPIEFTYENLSAGEETRTPTTLLPHGPEPCVSTNFTTPAYFRAKAIKNDQLKIIETNFYFIYCSLLFENC